MKYAYWLNNIVGIGSATIRCLLAEAACAKEIYELPPCALKKIAGITEKEVRLIHNSKKTWELDKKWFQLLEQGIGFTSLEQNNYPKRLQYIDNAPYGLYYIGDLPDDNRRSVAIVGARGRSSYGCEVARQLSKALAANNVMVISGLAHGIDTDAHKGALEGEGDTYAVLACGVDVCYPRHNRYLYEKIIHSGGIISEYHPSVQPFPGQFPARNRIISALSDCVVVVEAREKSGSLITADFAMEQGKDVYAVPGRVADELSAGCNRLIKQGAGIVQSVEDFLADLDILTENTYTQMDFRKNLLEKDERLVYSLTDFRPIGLGILVEKTQISIDRLLQIIERLEALGLIKETFTNYYVRTILK